MIDEKLKESIKLLDYDSDSYYIFDKPRFIKEVKKFKNTFKEINPIFSYSYKTNYVKPLIIGVDEFNFLSELVSPFEVEVSRVFGINPSKIIYNGPVKDDDSIKYVVKNRGLVNADNIYDLKRILAICSKLDLSFIPRLGIRFSFESVDLCSRFGIQNSEENIDKIVYQFKEYSIQNIECLHIHFPDRDIIAFEKRVNAALSLAKYLNESKIKINSIDIGGGFPSDMENIMQNSLGIKNPTMLSEYAKVLKKLKEFYNFKDLPVILEPGTAIASNSLHLVGHIKSINKKDKIAFFNTDISRTLLGGLKNHVKYPTVHIPTEKNADNSLPFGKDIDISLTGFSCVEGDIIGADIDKFKNTKIMDKFVLSSIGSYSCVFKSPFIRGDIALFIWDGENLSLSRRSQNANDINSLYL